MLDVAEVHQKGQRHDHEVELHSNQQPKQQKGLFPVILHQNPALIEFNVGDEGYHEE
jgi:hypothetical protein